ncbi:MAG: hypothetical protein KatS3mg031_0757 [Chitinophagales bacterium]|nr:MAG: hypothetical protein KatS3mg031_0757 [Chitinophagales bacterium]
MTRKPKRSGIVYSTDPDFVYQYEGNDEPETLPPARQHLVVRMERKDRGGKTVTLVEKFVGKKSDLEQLGKQLKTLCGTGGSVKDGIIILQGDWRKKVAENLISKGFHVSVG